MQHLTSVLISKVVCSLMFGARMFTVAWENCQQLRTDVIITTITLILNP